MRKPLLLLLGLAGLALLVTGCSSNRKASRQRYHDNPGTLGDLSARSAFMNKRVAEMTERGRTKESATAQASREWFNHASVPSQTPTAWELQRRKAQAKFEAELIKQKKVQEAGVR